MNTSIGVTMSQFIAAVLQLLVIVQYFPLQSVHAKSVYIPVTDDEAEAPVPVYCGRSHLFDEEHFNNYGEKPLTNIKRVVGGSISQRGEWPWLVSIQATSQFSTKSSHICGGSLINNQWFITASHCFELAEMYPGLQLNYTARVGEHHFLDDEDSQDDVEIEKILLYPGRTRANFDFDLTLVKLARKVKFNKHVNTICLPGVNDEVPTGTRMLTSGWGNTAEGGSGSDVVKHLSIPIIDHETCEKIYSNVTSQRVAQKEECDEPSEEEDTDTAEEETNDEPTQTDDDDKENTEANDDEITDENSEEDGTEADDVTEEQPEKDGLCRTVFYNETFTENVTIMDDMLCAGWMEGGHGNCQGDSGGPLIYYDKEIRGWILAGVVSFTNGCARPGYPAVYVKVSKYIPWIEKTIAENSVVKRKHMFYN